MYVPDDDIPEEICLTHWVDGVEELNSDKVHSLYPGHYKYVNAFEDGLPRRIRCVEDGEIVFLDKFSIRIYIYNCSYDWLCGSLPEYLSNEIYGGDKVRDWYWERLKIYASYQKRSLNNHFPGASYEQVISHQGETVINKVRLYENKDIPMLNVSIKDLKGTFLYKAKNGKLNL